MKFQAVFLMFLEHKHEFFMSSRSSGGKKKKIKKHFGKLFAGDIDSFRRNNLVPVQCF